MAISGGYVMRVWLISLTLRVPIYHLKKKNQPNREMCRGRRQFKEKKDKWVLNL